jgi:hypothetical protein
MCSLQRSYQLVQVEAKLEPYVILRVVVDPDVVTTFESMEDLLNRPLNFFDALELHSLYWQQSILSVSHFVQMISQVVQLLLVEPAHECPDDAADDVRRRDALHPVLVLSVQRKMGVCRDWRKRVWEAIEA